MVYKMNYPIQWSLIVEDTIPDPKDQHVREHAEGKALDRWGPLAS
jgi:hypothetical protein